MKKGSIRQQKVETVGIDLGDKSSQVCALNAAGEVVWEGSIATTKKALLQTFGALARCRIALEVGTHSPWVSRLLKQLGHEVFVANARQVRLISQSSRKTDKVDARMLARLARIDPELLRPIRHRSEQAQMHLMTIRMRADLVETRTALVNSTRGFTKSVGQRLPKCATCQWDVEHLDTIALPPELRDTLAPLIAVVEVLNAQIAAADGKIEQIARDHYPETQLLTQISGVGTLIALTFCLTVDDRNRFRKSRDVGCFLGLRPKRSQSGKSDPQLRITKEGDRYLRALLVQGAHRILSRTSPDTDLKRWGLKLAGRGGKNAKKRAIVAVARKLGILLHKLWVTGEAYEPLRQAEIRQPQKKAA